MCCSSLYHAGQCRNCPAAGVSELPSRLHCSPNLTFCCLMSQQTIFPSTPCSGCSTNWRRRPSGTNKPASCHPLLTFHCRLLFIRTTYPRLTARARTHRCTSLIYYCCDYVLRAQTQTHARAAAAARGASASRQRKIIITVSHDREFLDAVCSDCLHISGAARLLSQSRGYDVLMLFKIALNLDLRCVSQHLG